MLKKFRAFIVHPGYFLKSNSDHIFCIAGGLRVGGFYSPLRNEHEIT